MSSSWSLRQNKYPFKSDPAKDLLLVPASLIPHDSPTVVTTPCDKAGGITNSESNVQVRQDIESCGGSSSYSDLLLYHLLLRE